MGRFDKSAKGSAFLPRSGRSSGELPQSPRAEVLVDPFPLYTQSREPSTGDSPGAFRLAMLSRDLDALQREAEALREDNDVLRQQALKAEMSRAMVQGKGLHIQIWNSVQQLTRTAMAAHSHDEHDRNIYNTFDNEGVGQHCHSAKQCPASTCFNLCASAVCFGPLLCGGGALSRAKIGRGCCSSRALTRGLACVAQEPAQAEFARTIGNGAPNASSSRCIHGKNAGTWLCSASSCTQRRPCPFASASPPRPRAGAGSLRFSSASSSS